MLLVSKSYRTPPPREQCLLLTFSLEKKSLFTGTRNSYLSIPCIFKAKLDTLVCRSYNVVTKSIRINFRCEILSCHCLPLLQALTHYCLVIIILLTMYLFESLVTGMQKMSVICVRRGMHLIYPNETILRERRTTAALITVSRHNNKGKYGEQS